MASYFSDHIKFLNSTNDFFTTIKLMDCGFSSCVSRFLFVYTKKQNDAARDPSPHCGLREPHPAPAHAGYPGRARRRGDPI